MEEYFKCSKCEGITDKMYDDQCCGNLYCMTCKMAMRKEKSKCGKCKKDYEFQKNNFAQRMLKSIKVKCRYDCGNKFYYDDMKKHLLSCEKKMYKCTFAECDFSGLKDALFKHMNERHKYYLLAMMENYVLFKDDINQIRKGMNSKKKKKENTEFGNLFNLDYSHDIIEEQSDSDDDDDDNDNNNNDNDEVVIMNNLRRNNPFSNYPREYNDSWGSQNYNLYSANNSYFD